MAEEETSLTRAMRLVMKCQWQTQELKLKRTKMPNAGEKEHSQSRKRLVRKCEFPNAEAADEVIKFLSSDDCLDYLKFCRKQLNETVGENEDVELLWTPVQAWYSEEDATSGRARHGMLYHVLKAKDDDDVGDGPYVTTDGCKYDEEYTFYWDVDEPPELPKSSSGVQYSMDIKRRDDSDGLGGLYDCIMVKRTTIQQDVEPYESHHELGETRVTAQMLGVTGEDQEAIDTKIETFAGEHGLQLVDGAVKAQQVDEDGKPQVDEDDKPVMVVDHGVVVDISKEKNADCTTSVTIVNTKEEKNLRSTVVGEQTIRAKKLTVVDENVGPEDGESDDTYPLVTREDGKVVRKTVTKTKGGVRVIQTETTEAVPVEVDKGTTICETTLFEHQHTTIAEAQTPTTKEATVVNKTTAGAQVTANGHTYRVQSTLRDDGKFDIQSTETEELPVNDYVEHVTENGMSHTVDVTKKNQSATTLTEDKKSAKGNDYNADKALTDTQVTRTPGGAYDVRTVTRTPKKSSTEFEFNKRTTARGSSKLTICIFENQTATEVKTLIANGYTDGSIRLNEFGLYDGQLQKYDVSEGGGGGSDFTPTEAWGARLFTKNGTTQMGNETWKYTESWVEAEGVTDKSLETIYSSYDNVQDIRTTPADREYKWWRVHVESTHYFTYTSLTSSRSFTEGVVVSPSDFGKPGTTPEPDPPPAE